MTKLLHSLESLMTHLIADNLKAIVMAEMAMEKAAKIVQKDAQDRIGEYQAETGQFSAWAPLAESTEAEKSRLGYPTGAPLLREGDLRDSIVTEHHALEAVVGSKSPIAAYQEFGTNTIPPRPFIGPAGFAKRKEIHRLIGIAVAKSIGGNPRISIGYSPSDNHGLD